MKKASALSVTLHAAVLAWATLSFTGKTFETQPVEALPVDLVSNEEFSKLSKGAKDAPKKEEPKPLVEKKAEEPKKVEDVKPKAAEKKEVTPPPPAADPTPPPPEPKPDQIADKLKKPDEPKPQQVTEQKPLPPKRPPQPPQQKPPKFDADKIAALLDKRDPQRSVATGDLANQTPALGTSTGNDKKLSASEIDALRARLMALWNPPVGIQNPEELVIRIRLQLQPDGRLAGPPIVVTSGTGPLYNSARDSAIRAVFRAQPFNMLKRDTYDAWRDIEVTFDPRDMFRG